MKKLPVLLVLLACACFCAVSSHAQDKPGFTPEWTVGINGGATLSRVNFSPKVFQESLQQFQIGASFKYLTEKNFGLQGELNLSQRGWKEKKDSVPEHQFTKELLYLELPLMTHIYFDMGSSSRMVFNLGPQFSYHLSDKIKVSDVHYEPGQSFPDGEPIQYITPTQTKIDWGLVVGGGLELRTGIGSFVVEARYYYGLSDIYKNAKKEYYGVSSNQVLNLKLTYFIKK